MRWNASPGKASYGGPGFIVKKGSRSRVTAVPCSVLERPKCSEWLTLCCFSTEQPCGNPKKNFAALDERVRLLIAPGKRAQQRKPAILQARQLGPADARGDQVGGDTLQTRLGRSAYAPIEFFKPLAPPRHSDRAEPRIAGGRKHIGERQIQSPQCRKGGSQVARKLFENDLPIVVELPLSDR